MSRGWQTLHHARAGVVMSELPFDEMTGSSAMRDQRGLVYSPGKKSNSSKCKLAMHNQTS